MSDSPATQESAEAIEGEGVDVTEPGRAPEPEPAAVEQTSGQELERMPGREVLMPMDPGQVVEGMRAYQQLLKDLLDDSDWQGTGDGRFAKKSAWRKIARAFNLSVTIVSMEVARDEEGSPIRAECIARAAAPNGQVQDADGYCSISEFTGKRADDVKLENTLRATATTRAKNRAIADLVGMGEVSAEEVQSAGPPFGPPQEKEEQEKLAAALRWLLPTAEATAVWDAVKEDCGGYIPGVVSRAMARAIRARRDVDEGGE
jgi:hypothetical protein